jgi:hypothetical protein
MAETHDVPDLVKRHGFDVEGARHRANRPGVLAVVEVPPVSAESA